MGFWRYRRNVLLKNAVLNRTDTSNLDQRFGLLSKVLVAIAKK